MFFELDARELQNTLKDLKGRVTEHQVDRVMSEILQESQEEIRNVVKQAIPTYYYAEPGEIDSAVGTIQTANSGGSTNCIIPISGPKKTIGSGFSAGGGARGWNRRNRRYRIVARIVKGQESVLPANAASYGGQPPFRNLGSRLGSTVYTRGGAKRFPIMKMSGLSVAQMAKNRAKDDIESGIQEHLEEQMEQRLNELIGGKG